MDGRGCEAGHVQDKAFDEFDEFDNKKPETGIRWHICYFGFTEQGSHTKQDGCGGGSAMMSLTLGWVSAASASWATHGTHRRANWYP